MEIKITIAGITPIMLDNFHDGAQIDASKGSSSASAARDDGTPLEQAERRLYTGLDGKTLIIPSPNILRCLVDGGAFHKAGRSKITTQRSSLLYACLSIDEVEVPIVHKQPWKVDSRPVRNPKTGGRFLCHRPMFDDWQLTFTAQLDTSIINAKLFRDIVDDAGRRCGLGVFRPSTKGPYGRFVVVKWVEVKPSLQTAAAA